MSTMLTLGSQGRAVRALQTSLNTRFEQLGMIDSMSVQVDGRFDHETLTGVKYLQCVGGLPVNGQVDLKTQGFIHHGEAGLETLAIGSQGTGVMAVQQVLASIQIQVETNGCFDELTARGVRIYQQRHGLVADGTVGLKTWEKVVRSRLQDLPCLALLPDPYAIA
ncbi:MAG: peptidoglycan-binding protein [Phormidesmis sp.]